MHIRKRDALKKAMGDDLAAKALPAWPRFKPEKALGPMADKTPAAVA